MAANIAVLLNIIGCWPKLGLNIAIPPVLLSISPSNRSLASTIPPAGPFFTLLVKGPELGAQPSVYLAVAEELEGVTGRYYDVMTEKEPAPQALDEEAARMLWEVSSRLVGLEEERGQTGKMNTPAEGQSKAAQANPAQTSPAPAVRGVVA